MKPAISKFNFRSKHISAPLLFFAALFSGSLMPAHAETPVQAWVQRYNNTIGSDDRGKKVVTDSNGNVIVLGSTTNTLLSGFSYNGVLIKYSGDGLALWTNHFNGVTNSITVDVAGNIFVASYSHTTNGNGVHIARAYSGTGALLWTNQFLGEVNSIAADNQGGVCVVGYYVSGVSWFSAVSYSSSGVAVWTNRYTRQGTYSSSAQAVAVGGSGNVFVTGYAFSASAGTSADFTTIAYSGLGIPLWTNFYNGPENTNDTAIAVAVDGSGNVFVTGQSQVAGNYYDYATVAYSSTGAPMWTNRYNGLDNGDDRATGLAVESSGNVYVTGYSFGNGSSYDYATVAYSSIGTPMWTNRYNGPGSGADHATGLAVESSGNVFVTGFSPSLSNSPYNNENYATVAYTAGGIALWTNHFDGPLAHTDRAASIATDTNGKVFVTGYSTLSASGLSPRNANFATIAYSTGGAALWTNWYSASNMDDRANGVAVSADGIVFVTGSSMNDNAPTYLTIAYSGAGEPLWTNRYIGSSLGLSSRNSQAKSVTVDGSGNVLVAGCSSDWGDFEYATIKYSSGGLPLWTNVYGTSVNEDDVPVAVAVDTNGNVFVTGYSTSYIGYFNSTTVGYSGAGVPLWTNRYTGPTHSEDKARALAVDSGGNIFVTGLTSGYSGTGTDYVTIKYSGSGVPLWTNRYNGPANSVDVATAMGVDANGNILVTGHSIGSNGTYDYATIKYSNNGIPLWTNLSNFFHTADHANALALDASGNVFVTGYSWYSSDDYATIKYSSAGIPVWTNRYGRFGEDDQATGIVVDLDGNVFVTGFSMGSGGNYDYATIKYSNGGTPLWTNRYNGPANGNDLPATNSCIAVGPDGAVYVTGSSYGGYPGSPAFDFATVKYISTPEIKPQPASRTNNIGTTVAFSIKATGSASLRYQWQRSETNLFNGGNVSGVNSNTLTLANVQLEDAGGYRVIVTNAFGSVTSSVAVLTVAIPSPIALSSATMSNGVFRFFFTNTPGANFTVLSTTNVSLPLSNWTALGSLVEFLPGQFRFTHSNATTNQQRFYCVRAP